MIIRTGRDRQSRRRGRTAAAWKLLDRQNTARSGHRRSLNSRSLCRTGRGDSQRCNVRPPLAEGWFGCLRVAGNGHCGLGAGLAEVLGEERPFRSIEGARQRRVRGWRPGPARVVTNGGVTGRSGATPRPFEIIAFAFTRAVLKVWSCQRGWSRARSAWHEGRPRRADGQASTDAREGAPSRWKELGRKRPADRFRQRAEIAQLISSGN